MPRAPSWPKILSIPCAWLLCAVLAEPSFPLVESSDKECPCCIPAGQEGSQAPLQELAAPTSQTQPMQQAAPAFTKCDDERCKCYCTDPQKPTFVFVSGAAPGAGEEGALLQMCQDLGWNFCAIRPGTASLSNAYDLVSKCLEQVAGCTKGPLLVVGHSKGCDPLNLAMRDYATGSWQQRSQIVFLNPPIPGAAGTEWLQFADLTILPGLLIRLFGGKWMYELQPSSTVRKLLWGRDEIEEDPHPPYVVIGTQGDPVFPPPTGKPAEPWVPIQLVDPRKDVPDDAVNWDALAQQLGLRKEELMNMVLNPADVAHAILLFLTKKPKPPPDAPTLTQPPSAPMLLQIIMDAFEDKEKSCRPGQREYHPPDYLDFLKKLLAGGK